MRQFNFWHYATLSIQPPERRFLTISLIDAVGFRAYHILQEIQITQGRLEPHD